MRLFRTYAQAMNAVRNASFVLKAQSEQIASQQREIEELHRILLEALRLALADSIRFRILLETPEIDARDEIEVHIQLLEAQVAQLEEHVV